MYAIRSYYAYVTIGWVLFLSIDMVHIMMNLDKDEREYKIEAISERNAAWAMVLVVRNNFV